MKKCVNSKKCITVKNSLKSENAQRLDYSYFEDLRSLAVGIGQAKISCESIVSDLKMDGKVELLSRYSVILDEIQDIFFKLGEDLREYNLLK